MKCFSKLSVPLIKMLMRQMRKVTEECADE